MMRSRRGLWDLFSKRFRPFDFQSRPFCTTNKIDRPDRTGNSNNKNSSKEVNADESSSLSRIDAYKQLDNLNFMTAARILFSDPPKEKKFGIDFHLVQLFFACLPSLAVYLVALYARSEMRRMEAEQELKKKAEEEAKAKEMELRALEEQEEASDPQLVAVKVRLEKLEETVKEIVDESKKKPNDASGNIQVEGGDKSQRAKIESKGTSTTAAGDTEGNSQKQVSKGSTSSAPVTETSQQNQKSIQKAWAPSDIKK